MKKSTSKKTSIQDWTKSTNFQVEIQVWKRILQSTQDIFIIKKVSYAVPVTYELVDEEGEDIVERSYENELEHTDY